MFSCTSTGYVDTYSLGQHTFTVDTTDYAGNSRSTSVTFDVVDTPPDSDGDGVTDDIDSGDGAFTDAIAGAPDTFGSIVSVDSGVTVAIVDAADPDGVEVSVSGSSGRATLSLCGFPATIRLSVGSSGGIFTCGSISTRMISGTAELGARWRYDRVGTCGSQRAGC